MTVRVAELLGGLSLACDVVSAFPPGKVLRTAVLAVELGRRADLDEATLRDAWLANLLRFLGCTGFSHEEGEVYGAGDDIGLRNVMAVADVADPVGTVRAVVGGVGRGRPLGRRITSVARLLGDGRAMLEHAHAQCEVSALLARQVGASDGVIAALEHICERWDGRGHPAGVAEEALAVAMRLHHIADTVEIFHHRGGRPLALAELGRRTGGHFDPALAAVFTAHQDELFAALEGPDPWGRFLDAEPLPHQLVDDAGVDAIARAFAHFADLKCGITVGHSHGVARLAAGAGAQLGLDPQGLRSLEQAAWLHDLGRIAVSNSTWLRPGPLDTVAWEQVRLHAYWTERILSRVEVLKGAAAVAAASHERVDGDGYPKALPAAAIPLPARVLAAADVAQALGQPRPHRPAWSRAEIPDLLRAEVRAGHLDADAVDAVLAASGLGERRTSRTPLTEREVEVLVYLARGKTNKEIGAILGISPRTVQNHVAHIYDKAGLHSRAGAAIFAVEHGLMG